MKKAYIKPTVEVIESGDVELLSASGSSNTLDLWSPDGTEEMEVKDEKEGDNLDGLG